MKESNSRPSIYVLVHGAWHGGWCWKKVKTILEAKGHRVFTPTLTGLGERSHLLTPQIGLNTHIKDVVSVLEYEDLYNVILLGHSYAGMVISGVQEKVANRISHLVYLDAFLPEDNKSVKDYLNVPSLDKIVKTKGDGWRIPFLGTIEDLGVTNKDDMDWVSHRIGDQPYKSFTETITMVQSAPEITKTFIQLSNFPWFSEAGKRAKSMGFTYHQMLSGGHNAMISKPVETTNIILHCRIKSLN